MPTSLELRAERATVWERMKEIRDAAAAGDITQEQENNWASAEQDIEKLDKRIAILDKEERTPAAPNTSLVLPGTEAPNAKRQQAFRDWAMNGTGASPETRDLLGVESTGKGAALTIRMGEPGVVTGAERRALSAVSLTAGAATVPVDNSFAARLEVAMSWYGGMREAATLITTDTGADLPYPTANDTTNVGEVVFENGAFTLDVEPTFGAIVFKAYKYDSNVVRVPWELIQDTAINLEAQLAEWLGIRIARIQNTHWTIGVGASQPTGITLLTTQGRAGATGTSTSVTWDDLIQLEHSVNKSYRDAGRYMFHDQTLRDLRRIKDGDGNYIWQPGLTVGAPSLINGFSYVINNDMPTMAASVNSILFGDLSKYIIRQVRDVQIIRLDELYARNGQVGFVAWARADGYLIDAGTHPVKHFTNSAS